MVVAWNGEILTLGSMSGWAEEEGAAEQACFEERPKGWLRPKVVGQVNFFVFQEGSGYLGQELDLGLNFVQYQDPDWEL